MENFKLITCILATLEQELDKVQPDINNLSFEKFGVSEPRFNNILEMLNDSGLVKGLQIVNNAIGKVFLIRHLRITLLGLEYLRDNCPPKSAWQTG